MKVYGQTNQNAAGYVMAALLVTLAVMAVLLSVAMPVWHQAAQREKEEELVFRGKQYVRAIGLYQKKFANTFPPSIDILVEQKFLRKKYKDPMTADGEFQLLYQVGGAASGQTGTATPGTTTGSQPTGQSSLSTSMTSAGSQSTSAFSSVGPRGGIVGVTSKSTALSIRLYNGRSHYNEWQFVYSAPTVAPGGGRGGARPGQGGPGGVGVGSGQGPGRGGMGGGRGPGGPGSIFAPGRGR
jgi:type II secretory pathway pseudopilin PulG